MRTIRACIKRHINSKRSPKSTIGANNEEAHPRGHAEALQSRDDHRSSGRRGDPQGGAQHWSHKPFVEGTAPGDLDPVESQYP